MTTTCAPWATADDVCAPCEGGNIEGGLLTASLQMASDVLYDLTRRRWPGACTDTVRPCSGRSSDWCGCSRPRSCGCARLSEVRLPGSPITGITSVKVDGVTLDSARYRVDDGRWLVYLPDDADPDDPGGWPCCQRLERASSEDETFEVAYAYGMAPPAGGVRAAASLACQLALACQPDASGCRLPKRITTITRQGVSLAVLDPLTLFAEGLTGLAEVDLWVQAVNRGNNNRRATVVVPGRGRAHRRTNTDA